MIPTIVCFFFNDTATTEIYTLSLHDALPICARRTRPPARFQYGRTQRRPFRGLHVLRPGRTVPQHGTGPLPGRTRLSRARRSLLDVAPSTVERRFAFCSVPRHRQCTGRSSHATPEPNRRHPARALRGRVCARPAPDDLGRPATGADRP